MGMDRTVAEEGVLLMATNPGLGEGAVCVETVVPPPYVAYHRAGGFPGEALRADDSAPVESTPTAEGDAMRPRVVESGSSTPGAPERSATSGRDSTSMDGTECSTLSGRASKSPPCDVRTRWSC